MKQNPIIAKAYYNGEMVDIIDMIHNPIKQGEVEYLINYNGPTWVKEYDLNNIVYVG